MLEANIVENDLSSWMIDSGSTNHICSSIQMLECPKQLEQEVMTMRVGNGALFLAKAYGIVRLNLENMFLVSDDVYFIPGFSRNIISLSLLHEQNLIFISIIMRLLFRNMGMKFVMQY